MPAFDSMRGEERAPPGLGKWKHVLEVRRGRGRRAHHRRVERPQVESEQPEEDEPGADLEAPRLDVRVRNGVRERVRGEPKRDRPAPRAGRSAEGGANFADYRIYGCSVPCTSRPAPPPAPRPARGRARSRLGSPRARPPGPASRP